MNHFSKYKQLKKKYLELKRINSYNFLYFGNTLEQEKFIKKNFEKIVEMNMLCFPSGISPHEVPLKKYREISKLYRNIIESLIENNIDKQWFFAVINDKLIGYCFLMNDYELIKTDLKLETYRIINISENNMEKIVNVEKGPIINSLCKDSNYKKVGAFLIEKILEYLQKNEYDKVFIIPGSSHGKINYFYFTGEDACKYYDYEKYYQANLKLINYYKKLGFKISKKLYDIEKCKENNETKFHLYNVLFKTL